MEDEKALRSATIKLAFENPSLRGELLPLLMKTASDSDEDAVEYLQDLHDKVYNYQDGERHGSGISPYPPDDGFDGVVALLKAKGFEKEAGELPGLVEKANKAASTFNGLMDKIRMIMWTLRDGGVVTREE